LAETIRNEAVEGHPLTLVSSPPAAAIRRCHILFVPANAPNPEAALKAADGAPVLTVGETEAFLRAGGALRFAVDGGRVRFDVNPGSAARVGITLSSRLLQVARKVEP
jgi:hypothetical protein